ncbi:hypothetical protein [Prosthecobacter fusiformis]|nr:hypothetical protein [Prosthecobacter fusiformis]
MPFSPVGNLLGTLMDPGYIIPEESSVWTFTPSVMNSGSGDWWMYGEDSRHYYHNIGLVEYAVFPRSEASKCKGFNPHDIETWCPAHIKIVNPEEVER